MKTLIGTVTAGIWLLSVVFIFIGLSAWTTSDKFVLVLLGIIFVLSSIVLYYLQGGNK